MLSVIFIPCGQFGALSFVPKIKSIFPFADAIKQKLRYTFFVKLFISLENARDYSHDGRAQSVPGHFGP